MIDNFERWKSELLSTGRIIQDGDKSVSSEEAEKRFNRYVELVDTVEGDEGVDAMRALIDSIQSEHDYGAYQATLQAIMRFPYGHFTQGLIAALPGLMDRHSERAGELVSLVADGWELDDAPRINGFNRELSECNVDTRSKIINFIREQERDGWLEEHIGILAPNDSIM